VLIGVRLGHGVPPNIRGQNATMALVSPTLIDN
jgi:hypothetical protein